MQYGNILERASCSSIFSFKSYYVVWKRAGFLIAMPSPKKFKSYYVVWKPISIFSFSVASWDCLNRTMQYGNSFIFRTSSVFSDRFKSYYVVWKHERWKNSQEEWQRMFKSYYVVWKLMCFDCSILRVCRFKSYYVVWKRNTEIQHVVLA